MVPCEPRISADVLTWRLTRYLAQCLQAIAALSALKIPALPASRRMANQPLSGRGGPRPLALVAIEAADRRVLASC